MRALHRKHLPATAVSIALLAMTAAWYLGVYEFKVSNRLSKDGWSETPLGWMFILIFAPVCFFIGIRILLRVEDRLSALDVCAILAAASPLAVFLIGLVVAFLIR